MPQSTAPPASRHQRPTDRPPRPGRSLRAAAAAIGLFSGFFGVLGPSEAAETDETAFSRLYFGLQPPADREAERSVDLVLELLASGRTSEAAPLVAECLAAPEDALGTDGRSLKAKLREAIAELDPKALRTLRAVLQGSYRRRLAESTSLPAVRRLVAEGPAELFGPAGLATLAQAEEDRGAYALAAEASRRAAAAARDAGDDALASRLDARRAANLARLGQTEEAGALAREAGAAELRRYLASLSTAPRPDRAPQAWAGAAGDASRQAVAPGGLPSPWRWWRVDLPTTASADAESAYGSFTASTVAAGGLVVTATPDGLVAIDAATGKRVWRAEHAATAERRVADAPAGLATDGRAVFTVTPSPAATRDSELPSSGLLRDRQTWTAPNALCAYGLATGGKLLWRLDGGDPTGPLAGAAMLGPPAASDGRLYALAERDQTICLVVLDAESGAVEWVQTLARLQRDLTTPDAVVAASPTVGPSRVYCPTGRGAVVAVDPIARQIDWTHYLSVEGSASPSRARGWRGFGAAGWLDDNAAWRHCRAVESEGVVVIVSPALPTLEAVDARSGRRLWFHKHDDGLALAAVTDRLVVTLERERLVARRLTDGDRLWSAPLPEGDRPAGEGLVVEDPAGGARYVTPLASGRLAVVDLESSGESERVELVDLGLNPLETPPAPGDLLYHRGFLLSRSEGALECYVQPERIEPTLREATEALAAGDYEAARRRLLAARDAAPRDQRIAERLAVALLESPGDSDPAVRADELLALAGGPRAEAQAALLRLDAALANDRLDRAVDEAVRLATTPAGAVVLQPTPGWRVAAARLAAGRLVESEAASRAELAERVAGRLDSLGAAHADAARVWLGGVLPTRRLPSPVPIESPSITDWSLREVEAEVTVEDREPRVVRSRRSRRRDQADRSRRLRVDISEPTPGAVRHWRVETRNGAETLLGLNAWGEPIICEPAISDISVPEASESRDDQPPRHRQWADWLALRLDEGYAVYRVDPADRRSGPVWTNAQPPAAAWRDAGDGDGPEAPLAVGPWGVVGRAGRELRCRELATGALRWRRDLSERLDAAPRVLRDSTTLYVTTGDDTDPGVRVSPWTGRADDEPYYPPAGREWLGEYGGRYLLVGGRPAGGRELRLEPIDRASPTVWRRDLSPATRVGVSESGLLALLDEDLRLTVVDLGRGQERFTVSLSGPPEPLVRAVRLRETGGALYVEVDRSNPMVDRSAGVSAIGDTPLLTGELHRLDPRTGQSLWPRPVEVEALTLLDPAVRDCPVLLLGRRLAPESEDERAEAALALVALDPLTGASVFADHTLPAGDESRGPSPLWVQRETAASDRVVVRLGRATVRLTPTGPPAAPRPPMLAGVEDPYATRTKDARDIERGFDRFLKSLFDND